MRSHPVVHFEIDVADMTRAKAFYEAVFETTLEQMPNPNPEVEMDTWFFPMGDVSGGARAGAGGMLVKMNGFSPGSGGTLVYFA